MTKLILVHKSRLRGELKNNMMHQKQGIAVNRKYRDATKDGVSVETKYLAAGAEIGAL